ncbi:MAG: hypothetical protein CFE32_14885 [Alphaproteobacteria bacterium PA3]|nr:MAG: hypothetical protein CFE32_14885 [Alphaproteobacteria bacterium PA3]
MSDNFNQGEQIVQPREKSIQENECSFVDDDTYALAAAYCSIAAALPQLPRTVVAKIIRNMLVGDN